jgi:uncharacterized protein DUF2844
MSEEHPRSIKSRVLAVGTALVLLVAALPVWACLGGDASSVQTDQVQMQGTRTVKAAESYTVHEIQGANGTVVKEFVTAEGKVFAVAWHGPWMPDLRQILGSYFDQFTQAAQAQNSSGMGRRPLMINQPGLVVQNGGHLRAFSGKAYVPGMLPSGVRAEDIQ